LSTNIKRTFDLFEVFRENPDTIGKMTLGIKEDGDWRKYSVQEYIEFSNYVSYGLLSLGFQKGDKIATITNNRPEWNFIEMGASQIGVVHVPIFPNINKDEFIHILNHSDSKYVFVSSNEIYVLIKSLSENVPNVQAIYSFDKIENVKNFSEIIDLGKQNISKYKDYVEKSKMEISEDDLLTIIYTSGTTGLSKGVMLSHKNLMSNAVDTAKIQNLDYKCKALSFLPLSHVFEHMVNYEYQILGVSIYYAESISKIVDNIKELQVDGFITVPRLLESIFERIMSKGNDLKGIKKIIFFWAVNLGFKFIPFNGNNFWYRIKLKIADKLVFVKWREVLSPNIRFLGCGGAALQPRIAKLFWAAGLPVFEGYGLTETSPVLAVNYPQPGSVKLGTVGPVLTNIEIKIAPDGEILAKGPSIMIGYYKDPDHTKEVIDAEGWFHTGDIGNFEDNKYLKITDRKKEIFKLSNGKYVAPQVLENKMKESFFIDQAMILGENKKFISMLVSPNFKKLKEWSENQKIDFNNHHELIHTPKVVQHFQKEIAKVNVHLSQWEKVKKFKIVVDEWTHQTGELSPSLKLKRKVISKKYKALIEKFYDK
jgi:long-chain acyl-CoA synthetase